MGLVAASIVACGVMPLSEGPSSENGGKGESVLTRDLVALLRNGDGAAFCTAVLIGNDRALTAAHCFTHPQLNEPALVAVDGERRLITSVSLPASFEPTIGAVKAKSKDALYDIAYFTFHPPLATTGFQPLDNTTGDVLGVHTLYGYFGYEYRGQKPTEPIPGVLFSAARSPFRWDFFAGDIPRDGNRYYTAVVSEAMLKQRDSDKVPPPQQLVCKGSSGGPLLFTATHDKHGQPLGDRHDVQTVLAGVFVGFAQNDKRDPATCAQVGESLYFASVKHNRAFIDAAQESDKRFRPLTRPQMSCGNHGLRLVSYAKDAQSGQMRWSGFSGLALPDKIVDHQAGTLSLPLGDYLGTGPETTEVLWLSGAQPTITFDELPGYAGLGRYSESPSAAPQRWRKRFTAQANDRSKGYHGRLLLKVSGPTTLLLTTFSFCD